jgi:hypothetical protein
LGGGEFAGHEVHPNAEAIASAIFSSFLAPSLLLRMRRSQEIARCSKLAELV